ncbi:serine/threonine-protein kinase [Actinomadura yumaensis]|uniref:serine/threonine-protein kinase n=1 Tax=Actinomadura yumaensis TaxID=111807 RepID=UPI003615B954
MNWDVPGYSQVRTLGEGPLGRVVRAAREAAGGEVALRYLAPAAAADGRVRAEAGALAGLRHPHVVGVLDHVHDDRGDVIVMELVDGVTLERLLGRSGRLAPEAALYVFKASLLALAAVHGLGIPHRDLRPGNVMVDAAGAVKVGDFGIVFPEGDHVPGTPAYTAPELWAGEQSAPPADLYAATAVFYQCLTGRLPFDGAGALEHAHREEPVPLEPLPAALRPLVARGLAKYAPARPESAEVFAEHLQHLADAAYGEGWERRGVSALAAAAALLSEAFPVTGAGPMAVAAPPRPAGSGERRIGRHRADDGPAEAGQDAPAAPAARRGGRGRSKPMMAVGVIAVGAVAGAGAFAVARATGAGEDDPKPKPSASRAAPPKPGTGMTKGRLRFTVVRAAARTGAGAATPGPRGTAARARPRRA